MATIEMKRQNSMEIPQQARWAVAEEKANELNCMYSMPPIPVLEIAEQNGVDVVFEDFGKFKNEVSGLCDFSKARIYVNKDDSIERQAFTMAHELGHWILHRDIFLKNPDIYPILPRFQQSDRDNVLEKEANKFAACLLVPKSLLDPVRSAPVGALAKSFGVSRTMMEFRLKDG